MTQKEQKEFDQMKNAIDALINRQRQIMKALKLNGIDIELTCDIDNYLEHYGN